VEQSFAPAADVVVGAQTVVTYDNVTAAVNTIATWTKASIQSLADTPGLQTWLDQRVSYAAMLKAEAIFMTDLMAAAGALATDFTPTAAA
jgi:HK97 family phage major capsid protein